MPRAFGAYSHSGPSYIGLIAGKVSTSAKRSLVFTGSLTLGHSSVTLLDSRRVQNLRRPIDIPCIKFPKGLAQTPVEHTSTHHLDYVTFTRMCRLPFLHISPQLRWLRSRIALLILAMASSYTQPQVPSFTTGRLSHRRPRESHKIASYLSPSPRICRII